MLKMHLPMVSAGGRAACPRPRFWDGSYQIDLADNTGWGVIVSGTLSVPLDSVRSWMGCRWCRLDGPRRCHPGDSVKVINMGTVSCLELEISTTS